MAFCVSCLLLRFCEEGETELNEADKVQQSISVKALCCRLEKRSSALSYAGVKSEERGAELYKPWTKSKQSFWSASAILLLLLSCLFCHSLSCCLCVSLSLSLSWSGSLLRQQKFQEAREAWEEVGQPASPHVQGPLLTTSATLLSQDACVMVS